MLNINYTSYIVKLLIVYPMHSAALGIALLCLVLDCISIIDDFNPYLYRSLLITSLYLFYWLLYILLVILHQIFIIFL